MIKILLVGLLSGQLVILSCVSNTTIKRSEYAKLRIGLPLEPSELEKIKNSSPKDAVFADLLQAFALMRTGIISNKDTQKEITNLLTSSVATFEDMTDPVNFSKAFSVDEDKDFRGRPHERSFAALITAVFLMNEKRYDLALSYLRNAEFLDARFQKMPFGTDAPLVYALMYWCLHQQKSDPQEIKRAHDGLKRSVRFLSWQEPLLKALVEIASVDMRPMAIANRMAYMIFEISIYYSLINSSNNISLEELLDNIIKNSEIFISALNTNFEDEYKTRMMPVITELAQVYNLEKKEGIRQLEELAFGQLSLDIKNIGQRMKQVFRHHDNLKHEINQAIQTSYKITEEILTRARSSKIMLNFTGMGPTLERKGSYDEISVVKPSPEANLRAAIRTKNIATNISCGMHRTSQGGFNAVLCGPRALHESSHVENLLGLELLSLSRKATTAGGRKFEEVLKGRAQFRAATENIATVGAWSAFFLFHMGANIIDNCNRRGQGEACYAPGLVLWAFAGVTVVFSGTAWLIGRASNPAADSRFIHLMYESAWFML